jgi:predicted DNA-binding transcriptional regulator YafY
MSKIECFRRYLLIIKKLRKSPATFDEIDHYLEDESMIDGYNYRTSKRTFQRDIEEIDFLFRISILYDFSKKVYFIDADENETDINGKILESFDTFHALNVTDKLSDFIYIERRKNRGTENLYDLIYAIKNHFVVKYSYEKYWDDEITIRNVEPYALKEFKDRWYVIAKDACDGKMKSFALDRITNLEVNKEKFQKPSDFEVKSYYKNCFGIVSPNDQKPSCVILSFRPYQGKYIKSLPLHESQEVITDTDEEFRVKLELYITHDFEMEILALGNSVKIIEPMNLIEKLKDVYINALKQYE